MQLQVAPCNPQNPRIQIVSGAIRRYRPFNIQVTLDLAMIELAENNGCCATNSTLQSPVTPPLLVNELVPAAA